jgi:hypothetical protein
MKHDLILYNGEVEIVFDDKAHTYRHRDSNKLIANPSSVHNILAKPFLIPWAAKKSAEHIGEVLQPYTEYTEVEVARMVRNASQAHTEYSADRMVIGHYVHGWIEGYIKWKLGLRAEKKIPGKVSKEILNGIHAFLDFDQRHSPRYLFSERVVYSRLGDHIGTCDAACEIQGKIYTTDWKTGAGIYLEHAYQTASYSAALTEESPETYDWPERLVVKLSTKTGKASEYWEKDIQKKLTGHTLQQDYQQYRRLVDCWYTLQDGPQAWSFK